MDDCIFCKIVEKEIPAEMVYEDEKAVVFKDINPKSKVHLLIVPRKHIASVNDLQEDDSSLVGHLHLVAKKVAEDLDVARSGYKLLVNVGKGAGQEVFHLHIHLLA